MRPMLTTTQVAPAAALERDMELLGDPAGSPSIVEVLWRHRLTFAAAVTVCLMVAAIYLVSATRIYRSVADVYVQQNAQQVMNEHQLSVQPTDGFLFAQANAMQSAPVLSRALKSINYQSMQTFARVSGDPVAWLRAGNGLDVEPDRKSDSLLVSMDSPYPREAAAIVNAVVDAYVAETSQQDYQVGTEMVTILRKQLADVEQQRQATYQDMLKLKEDNQSPSLREDQSNDVLNRMSVLSKDYSDAELEIIDLQARQQSARAILTSPEAISDFVESQQAESRDAGDTEYRDLRSQLSQASSALSLGISVQGENNPRIAALRTLKQALEAQVAAKERSIAEASLADITRKLSDCEQEKTRISAELDACRQLAIAQGGALARFASLSAELARLDQSASALESRIAEVTANSADAGRMNVRVLDPAQESQRPVWPGKSQIVCAAVLMGLLLGSGVSVVTEWRKGRFSAPAEVEAMLRIPIIGMVPEMNRRLPPSARGQLVYLDERSPVAESYRSICTTLHHGQARDARTILIASPMPGDGKSTAASNLAIAFARNGCRTLLLDCNLREPVQQMIFGIDGGVGLTNVVAGERTPLDAIYRTQVNGLHVMPCGPSPISPPELLAGEHFAQVLASLREMYDRIIIDSPPLCNVTDGRILAASCDATLLVLRMNQSMRAHGLQAVSGLRMVGARVVGVIANGVSTATTAWGYEYGGGSREYSSFSLALPMPVTLAAKGGNRESNARISTGMPAALLEAESSHALS